MTARARAPLAAAGVARLAAAVVRAERARVAALSITFVGPARMRSLNRVHLGHDRVTDVIAFGMKAAMGNGEWGMGSGLSTMHSPLPIAHSPFPVVGDIYICPAVATANAKRHGTTAGNELRRLVIHGVLHVLGHDHPEGAGRTRGNMWRVQERYLARLGRLAP